jgi:hypothetical protein
MGATRHSWHMSVQSLKGFVKENISSTSDLIQSRQIWQKKKDRFYQYFGPHWSFPSNIQKLQYMNTFRTSKHLCYKFHLFIITLFLPKLGTRIVSAKYQNMNPIRAEWAKEVKLFLCCITWCGWERDREIDSFQSSHSEPAERAPSYPWTLWVTIVRSWESEGLGFVSLPEIKPRLCRPQPLHTKALFCAQLCPWNHGHK